VLAQAKAQRAEAQRREEMLVQMKIATEQAQRTEAKQREQAQRMEIQAQRAEAMKREELVLAREQMLAKIKAETNEATRKREQLYGA